VNLVLCVPLWFSEWFFVVFNMTRKIYTAVLQGSNDECHTVPLHTHNCGIGLILKYRHTSRLYYHSVGAYQHLYWVTKVSSPVLRAPLTYNDRMIDGIVKSSADNGMTARQCIPHHVKSMPTAGSLKDGIYNKTV